MFCLVIDTRRTEVQCSKTFVFVIARITGTTATLRTVAALHGQIQTHDLFAGLELGGSGVDTD